MCSGRAPSIDQFAAGHGDRRDVGGRLDPVGNRVMPHGMQRARLDAFDHQRRRADPADVGAHGDEELAEIGDLRFTGGVVDPGRAVGEHRRGEQVLGRTDAREVERDVGPVEPVGERLEVAVAELERGAHRFEAGDVHVDRTRAEVVAARQRQPDVTAAGEQRAEHVDRRPDPFDQFVRGDRDDVARVGQLEAARRRCAPCRRRSPPSRSPMIVTSAMSGTLVRWNVPSVSNVVAISFSTEFLAPGTVTVPESGPLPLTRMASPSPAGGRRVGRTRGASWLLGWIHGPPVCSVRGARRAHRQPALARRP